MSRRRTSAADADTYLGMVRNGRMIGSNTNWTAGGATTWDPEAPPGTAAGGSIAYQSGGVTILMSDLCPIDSGRAYRLSADVRSFATTGLLYAGFGYWDADGLQILARHHSTVVGSVTARLTAPLQLGDMAINVDTTFGWTSAGSYRRIGVHPYKSTVTGLTAEDGYTRHVTATDYTSGVITETLITLGFAWNIANPDHPAGIWPVGTELRNHVLTADYHYSLIPGLVPPHTDWRHVEVDIRTKEPSGEYQNKSWPRGTKNIRPIFFTSGQVAGTVTKISNVSIGPIT